MSEKKNRGEKEDDTEAIITIFLKGIWGLCGYLTIHAKKTCGSNWFFSLRSISIGRSVSLGSVETSNHCSGAQFCQQILKNTLAYPQFLFPEMLPQSFEVDLFQEAFLTTPPQQVTPSAVSCGEFTDWSLSLTCLVYSCKYINFSDYKYIFAC